MGRHIFTQKKSSQIQTVVGTTLMRGLANSGVKSHTGARGGSTGVCTPQARDSVPFGIVCQSPLSLGNDQTCQGPSVNKRTYDTSNATTQHHVAAYISWVMPCSSAELQRVHKCTGRRAWQRHGDAQARARAHERVFMTQQT